MRQVSNFGYKMNFTDLKKGYKREHNEANKFKTLINI